MNYLLIGGLAILLVSIVVGFRLGWELLQQNGRMLLRMEALEKRLDKKEEGRKKNEESAQQSLPRSFPSDTPAPTATPERAGSAPTGDEDRLADRFGNRSLANSKIKRDGLKAGTPAPEFRLPRLDGRELALSDLRGKFVLLVFSSPHCGPCNMLAPGLQKFHCKHPEIELVMISRESPEDNRAKGKEHGLTFPVVLQKQWEVSRDYAYFATPVGYLIDESGLIAADVAVGVEPILELMKHARRLVHPRSRDRHQPQNTMTSPAIARLLI